MKTGIDGTILDINSTWPRLLGWSEAEILHRSFFSFLHPDDLEDTRLAFARLAHATTSLAFRSRYRHRDGTYRWLSWTGVAADQCLYVAAHDVTAEKEAAEALVGDDSCHRLQKLEVIEQLAGGIAHDFNNSFQNILASMELVRKLVAAGRGSEAERFVPSAMASAQRAAALARRWLDFSRPVSRSPRRVNINALLPEIAEVLRSALPSSINVGLDLAPDVWDTCCDENEIETAILELALRARAAMPDGGDIAIRTCNTEIVRGEENPPGIRAGQYVCISVIDSGAVLDRDALPRVSDDLAPVPADRPGLNLVRRFARKNGGEATIRSDTGAGTTVTVFLPRHVETGEKVTGE